MLIVSSGIIASKTFAANNFLKFQTKKKPNFLFISVDDLCTHLGCYGHKQVISPNIDKLASKGVLFSRAYCQAPVCGASRASLLTGIRPNFKSKRFIDAESRADKDAPYAITVVQHLKSNGYHTISNGKIFHYAEDSALNWSETPWSPHGNLKENFDKIWLDPNSKNLLSAKGRGPYKESPEVPDEAYGDGKVAIKTIQDLRRLKKGKSPFFLACGFTRPHLPFNAPKKYFNLYNPSKIDIADNRYSPVNLPSKCHNSSEIKRYSQIDGWPSEEKFHRDARHAYYACISYIDALIGKILDELNSLELDKNTIVVLFGDNGWHLGEHNFWGKHNMLNNTIHVPLIVRAPGSKTNTRTNALVEFVDIYPTLCELAGLSLPSSHILNGKSFVPVLKNPKQHWKDAAYIDWNGAKAVKTDRYLYTEWDAETKMLFDHKIDPDENVNIANKPENAKLIENLSALLNKSNKLN
ncbi:MAG: hypothetical protein A2Y10_05725 [Planctomycetes bacterium GWF2_41_51]|nr:MAG: hypothetical protein A2Y10_05725 [Planctomycetes bacterium GWF2_41_51]